MDKIQGVFSVLVTPFTLEQELNETLLRLMIRFQIAAGVNGIVVLGTTGESPTLTLKEKERIIRIAREETLGKSHLMVGTGSYSTAITIELTRMAKDLGADSALIVTPYYNKPTQEGLYLHYKAITTSVDLPILVYNNQPRTSQNMTTETLIRIAQLPYICGVKESSGSLGQIMEVIEKIGRQYSHFSVMSGDDVLTVPSIAMGGNGILSVVSNLVPVQVCEMVQAALKGDFFHARNLHFELMPLLRGVFIETNPIPIKAAMALSGINAGTCRLPLSPLADGNYEILKRILNMQEIAQFVSINQHLFQRVSTHLSKPRETMDSAITLGSAI